MAVDLFIDAGRKISSVDQRIRLNNEAIVNLMKQQAHNKQQGNQWDASIATIKSNASQLNWERPFQADSSPHPTRRCKA